MPAFLPFSTYDIITALSYLTSVSSVSSLANGITFHYFNTHPSEMPTQGNQLKP